ncbi:leucyl/phenylalanyl-tRNA--protein transferase [Paracoccus suum]|uniref:Leucyl/phenylalanyl-tRNA--protein transferase n=1 Tax=Paracoccus suum TaxID=2259340 RepID=A0A344PH13_9RHOB|nr:leucyl/phenylalanyl-tRNA--protein transferase [Paracoccus suum]AXC48668.1 leucyl/phenylalanyl-tRNA--protein transferase [Paracoccus suum]
MLSPAQLLAGYASGVFPMADRADDPELYWVDPPWRGVLPVGGIHLSRSTRRSLARGGWRATLNADFAGTVKACAARPETWINAPLHRLYAQLHAAGRAHSVEVWQDGALAGGVFGVSLGGAFFGESMFSTRTNGSKLALHWLSVQLQDCGFKLFDTQFLTPHLASLGGVEISRAAYHRRLATAILAEARLAGPLPDAGDLLARG